MKGSKTFSANIPNVAQYVTDCTLHLYSASGSSTVDVYFDNGTAGTAATIFVPWDTSGASDINLGFTTQSSPYTTISAVSGSTVYVALSYSVVNGFQLHSSTQPFSYSALRSDALADGGYFTIFASVETSSGVTVGGGGTTTYGGNGGANGVVKAL